MLLVSKWGRTASSQRNFRKWVERYTWYRRGQKTVTTTLDSLSSSHKGKLDIPEETGHQKDAQKKEIRDDLHDITIPL